MKKLFETVKNFNPTITFVIAMPSTFFVGAALLILGCRLSPADWNGTWIICFTGYLVGVPLGMLSSPHKGEASNFQFLGSHIAALFSGFVLAKLTSPVVEQWFASAASDRLRGGRVMLFISFLILGIMQTFILRNYSDKDRERDHFKDKEPKAK